MKQTLKWNVFRTDDSDQFRVEIVFPKNREALVRLNLGRVTKKAHADLNFSMEYLGNSGCRIYLFSTNPARLWSGVITVLDAAAPPGANTAWDPKQ